MTMFATLLAQTTQPAAGNVLVQLLPFLLMAVVIYMLMFRPQKRERDRQKQMLEGLKKNDRIMTIGGALGTVVSVKGDEITVKVDETTNTKITFTRSAIKSVISTAPQTEKPA